MTEPEINRSPAQLSSAFAVTAAAIALLTTIPSVAGVAFGVAGIGSVTAGLVRGSRRLVTLGAGALFGGVLLAGLAGASVESLLVGTAAVVLVWDVGEQAINVGEQLGRAAVTARGETAHAAASTVVGASGVGLGYAVYVLTTGGQPMTALVFLLLSAVLFASALRH